LGVFPAAPCCASLSAMPRSRNRGHVGTLGDLLHGRTLLYLNCNAEGCGHHRKMDLPALVAAHGEAMPLQHLVDRAICSRCGQRSVSVTVPPDLGERGGFSYRPYAG
jgi:hypothetical protein